MRNTFEHCPHHVGLGGAAGEAEQGAASAVIPVGCAHADESRHIHHAVARCDRRGHRITRLRIGNEPHVVDQPFHVAASGEHDCLCTPVQRGAL